jgi:hypothetical protein
MRTHAEAAVPVADRRARDRQLGGAERRKRSAMRRELEAVAGDPDRVAASRWRPGSPPASAARRAGPVRKVMRTDLRELERGALGLFVAAGRLIETPRYEL